VATGIRVTIARLRLGGHALLGVGRSARPHGEHLAGRLCGIRHEERRLDLGRNAPRWPASSAVIYVARLAGKSPA
jgi:hypothetical protein